MYWASGLHLYTPLPFRPEMRGLGELFKTHMFLTAGNLGHFRLSGQVIIPYPVTQIIPLPARWAETGSM